MNKLFNDEEGYYIPSFMYINIKEYIDMQKFEEHSPEVKGTFIHEYCHYLQDVSTTYGYNNFICGFQELLCDLFPNQYEQQKKELQWNKDFLSLHIGDKKLEGPIVCINDIQICKEDVYEELNVENSNEYVSVIYNGNKKFYFGNYCISESMAYLVEKQLYDIRERYDQFPYNICEMICKKEYEEFAKNEINIIALCELALLESCGEIFFVKALRLMKENSFIPQNIKELEWFISKHFNIGFRGSREHIISLLNVVYPQDTIKFDYVKTWIITRYEIGCRFREKSKCFIAWLLSYKENRFFFWQMIMDEFGCPNVVVGGDILLQGAYLQDKHIEIGYMLAPMVIGKLLKEGNQSCPFIKICKQDNPMIYTEECECNPMKKKDGDYLCPISLFCKMYSLKK